MTGNGKQNQSNQSLDLMGICLLSQNQFIFLVSCSHQNLQYVLKLKFPSQVKCHSYFTCNTLESQTDQGSEPHLINGHWISCEEIVLFFQKRLYCLPKVQFLMLFTLRRVICCCSIDISSFNKTGNLNNWVLQLHYQYLEVV